MMFNIFKRTSKIFCIGFNKTGTTSIERALKDLGIKLGNQNQALEFVESYKQRNFKPIIEFCRTADAFQDAPFSWPFTFMALEQAYPDAKFILTVRDSPEVWYNSLVRFHSKIFGDGSTPLSYEQMTQSKRPRGNTVWGNMTAKFDLDPTDPYQKSTLIQYYNAHNQSIREYFRFKTNLLEVNLKSPNSYQNFCTFLGKKPSIGTYNLSEEYSGVARFEASQKIRLPNAMLEELRQSFKALEDN